MQLSQAKEEYYYFSGKLSEINRQYCFAGIAIVWIFAQRIPEGLASLDQPLIITLIAFLLSLALDLMQYIYGSIAWGLFHYRNDTDDRTPETHIDGPNETINWPTIVFFWTKVLAALTGYLVLGSFMSSLLMC